MGTEIKEDSKDYKTLVNMLEMCKEVNKIYTHFEGSTFLDQDTKAGNLCYDMIIDFLELPKEDFDPLTGEGFCHDYWFNIISDYIHGEISLEEAIKNMIVEV